MRRNTQYLASEVELDIAGEVFVARGRQVLVVGWRALEQEPEGRDEGSDEESQDAALPPLRTGEKLLCAHASAVEKQTRPPKPFTDATLIQAMCGIAKYVSEPKARRVLSETDGLGTPATRASIIETLLERRFVERRRKQIRSTPIGRAFIDALPPVATRPDMTAVWESAIRRIHDGELELERFLAVVSREIDDLVRRGKREGALALPSAGVASSHVNRQRPVRRRSRTRTTSAGRAPGRAKS